jgi:hypothetical protein
MARELQPLEIICDAPPYSIVKACRHIGLESPEDVRWCHALHYIELHGYRPAVRNRSGWNELLALLGPQSMKCSCGGKVPPLSDFHVLSGNADSGLYHFGQCRRCKTIYWEKT